MSRLRLKSFPRNLKTQLFLLSVFVLVLFGACSKNPISSPNFVAIPSEISNGLVFWLDGGDPSSLIASDSCNGNQSSVGSSVGCWLDASGSGNHAIQNNLANQPQAATGGGISLISGRTMNAGSVLSGSFPEMSIFVVVQEITRGQNTSFNLNWPNTGCGGGPAERLQAHLPWSDGTIYWDYGGCGGRRVQVGGSAVVGQTFIYELRNSAADGAQEILQNAVLIGGNGAQPATINGSFNIGGSATGTTVLKEILVYSKYKPSSERRYIEGTLACKWGLQANLPATHTYATNCPD